jgi:ferredoxin
MAATLATLPASSSALAARRGGASVTTRRASAHPARATPSSRSRSAALVARASVVRVEFTPSDGGDVIVTDVTKASVLRDVALGDKVQLYEGMAKLLNCGGMGNCGTCKVRVTEGMELLSKRTDAENGKLKGLGEDWRLACQCLVGGDTAPEGAVLKVVNKPKK